MTALTLYKRSIIILVFSSFLLLPSCRTTGKIVDTPEELLGSWRTEEIKISVRERLGFNDFKFHSGQGAIELNFKPNGTVSGSIGNHTFSNAKLKKTNIYRVVCDSTGSIFPSDPIAQKEVSIWLHEIGDQSIKAELRLTEGGAKFPMAGFTLNRN